MAANTRFSFFPLLLLAVCAAWLSYTGYAHTTPPAEHSAVMQAPDFSWQAFDGSHHTLDELKGRPVVLHFWATWCGPCRAELPQLMQAAARIGNKTVFLVVSSDNSLDKPQHFLANISQTSGIKPPENMLMAFDPQKSLTFDIFQTLQFPETILMDSAHQMRVKIPGVADWNSAQMNAYLQQMQQ